MFNYSDNLSVLTFGSMALSNVYNPNVILSEAERTLSMALEAGMNCIHTAYHYGNGQTFIFIKSVINKYKKNGIKVIAKIDGHPDRMLVADDGIDNTRKLLGIDRIDFAQFVESNCKYPDIIKPMDIIDDILIEGKTFDKICKFKDKQLIKYAGIEAYTPDELELSLKIPIIDFVVIDQSIIRQVAHGEDIIDKINKSNKLIFAIRPLAGGWLTNKYELITDFPVFDNRREWYSIGEKYRKDVALIAQRENIDITELAIRFLINQNFISSIVIGLRTLNQLEIAIESVKKGALNQELYNELQNLFAQPIILEP
jgi:aryl-alcohol dehydrogenase-like predicted oxidoreductase